MDGGSWVRVRVRARVTCRTGTAIRAESPRSCPPTPATERVLVLCSSTVLPLIDSHSRLPRHPPGSLYKLCQPSPHRESPSTLRCEFVLPCKQVRRLPVHPLSTLRPKSHFYDFPSSSRICAPFIMWRPHPTLCQRVKLLVAISTPFYLGLIS